MYGCQLVLRNTGTDHLSTRRIRWQSFLVMLLLPILSWQLTVFVDKKLINTIYESSVMDPWQFGSDVDPDQRILTTDLQILTTDLRIRILLRILLFSSVTFKMPIKNNFFSVFADYFLMVRSHKCSTTGTVPYYFSQEININLNIETLKESLRI